MISPLKIKTYLHLKFLYGVLFRENVKNFNFIKILVYFPWYVCAFYTHMIWVYKNIMSFLF